MAREKSEQEVVEELEKFVVERLCDDFINLQPALKHAELERFCSQEHGPDVRQELADICSRMSLSIMRGELQDPHKNKPEARYYTACTNFLDPSPEDYRQLAWAQRALRILCVCSRDECRCSDEQLSEGAKVTKQVALYCEAMAMFSIGHLKSAQSEFARLDDLVRANAAGSPHEVGVCECLRDRYRVKCKPAMEKTNEVLKSLDMDGTYEKTKGANKFQLFMSSSKRSEPELSTGSPVKDISGVGDVKLAQLGCSAETEIKDINPSGSPSLKAVSEKVKTIMTIYGPPADWNGDILLESLAAVLGCVTDIVVVSWNVQLMNRVDGPNNDEIMKAIEDKAISAAKVAKEPGTSGIYQRLGASLVVIQEAPGPQLRMADKGKTSKDVAKRKLFTKELSKQPYFWMQNFKFREVALSNIQSVLDDSKTAEIGARKNVEMGEDHIFGWNRNILKPVKHDDDDELDDDELDKEEEEEEDEDELYETNPTSLKAPDKEKWSNRAPSWAEFEVLNTETTLIVVSVHAKSGGEQKTQEDIKMIGKAVDRLWESRKPAEGKDLVVLVVGDFNYPSSLAFNSEKPLISSHYTLAEQSDAKTNIWQFNGTGNEEGGQSFDYGFVRSTAGVKVKAIMNIPSVAKMELQELQKEMERFGQALKPLFDSCYKSCKTKKGEDPEEEELEEEAEAAVPLVQSSMGQTAVESMIAKFGKGDVPTWMREEFRRAVKLSWSDHLPIAISLAITHTAAEIGVPGVSNEPRPDPSTPMEPPANRSLESEMERVSLDPDGASS